MNKQARETTRAYIDSIGRFFYTLSTDKVALGTAIGGLSLAALGIYGARESTRLGRVLLERCAQISCLWVFFLKMERLLLLFCFPKKKRKKASRF